MKTPYSRQGFALPTVIISAVVMIIVLLAALVGVVSVSTSTKSQLYQRLAKEAAEAGIVAMRECMGSINASIATERDSLNGLAPDWRGCQDSTSLGASQKYLQTSTGYRSTFIVNSVTYNSGNYNFLSTGKVEILSPTGTIRDTIEYPMRFRIKGQSLYPSKPATGNAFVCAILSGENWCWGTNSNGEHGNGTIGGSRLPSQTKRSQTGTITYSGVAYPRALKKAEIDVSGGDNFACAISTDHPPANYSVPQTNITSNMVYCWGHQQEGQLGNGVNGTSVYSAPIPANNRWRGSGMYAVQVATGAAHACARTNQVTGSGNLWCWGQNTEGQVGVDNTNSPILTPSKAYTPGGSSTGGNFKYVTAANRNTCAIGTNDIPYCWGDNRTAQTGTNSEGNNILLPTAVKTSPNSNNLRASSIAMAARGSDAIVSGSSGHGCAISLGTSGETGDREGSIWCWGARSYGATGLSITSTNALRANDIASIGGSSTYYADSISASWRAVCALVRLGGKSADISTRRIYCWGSNRSGELGVNRPPSVATGSTYSSTNPNLNNRSPLLQTNVPQRIWIDPDTSSRDHFKEADVTEITPGGISYRYCVIAASHNYCWGRNEVGQTGDGTESGDYTSDPQTISENRFYPRLSIFSEPIDKGLIY